MVRAEGGLVMTNLSDEDLAAIAYSRNLVDRMDLPQADRQYLERVLVLAGEEPQEPDDQTFWYDPQDRIVYQRDDLQNPGFPGSWYATGRMTGESWRDMGAARRRLVQLVPGEEEPRTPIAGEHQEVLMDLLGAWEAEHRKGCGGSVRLSKCQFVECKVYWSRLHDLGVRTTWETVTS
jgi:broad specificity phosphatase PhoE